MSIASEITRIQGNISDAYTAISNKGGTLPVAQNSDNLATAIGTIPTGVAARERPYEVDGSGELIPSTTATTIMDFTGATKIVLQGLLQYAYRNNTAITGIVDMSDVERIMGSNACANMFSGCTNITGADLGSLTTAGASYACAYMFQNSGIASLDVGSLQTIVGFGCYYMCADCPNLTSVVFSSLTDVASYGLNRAFYRCHNISLSFPAIKTTSNISLAGICEAASGVTLHFPSNVQALIESLGGYSATAPFGAISGTVLFDLPATE